MPIKCCVVQQLSVKLLVCWVTGESQVTNTHVFLPSFSAPSRSLVERPRFISESAIKHTPSPTDKPVVHGATTSHRYSQYNIVYCFQSNTARGLCLIAIPCILPTITTGVTTGIITLRSIFHEKTISNKIAEEVQCITINNYYLYRINLDCIQQRICL